MYMNESGSSTSDDGMECSVTNEDDFADVKNGITKLWASRGICGF